MHETGDLDDGQVNDGNAVVVGDGLVVVDLKPDMYHETAIVA
jgi:hypothetical protein